MTRLTTSRGQRPRVAIVGGSQVGGLVATALVQQFGCTPLMTPGGESVLALLRSEERVDLALVDVSLPDTNGLLAVQLMRALGARGAMPIIALTEDRTDSAYARAGASGFDATVIKPYSPRELYGAMWSALTGARRRLAGATGL